MGNIILPKTYIPKIEPPLIFLAGPIRSAPLWQDEAMKMIFSLDPQVVIACPRREVCPELAHHVLRGDETYFPRQRAWEWQYLKRAATDKNGGAILFWLPGEAQHSCQKVYGAMTRLELGEWMTEYKHDPSVRFCVGSDGAFPELHTIAYDFGCNAPEKDIKKTLEETCQEAVRLAKPSLQP